MIFYSIILTIVAADESLLFGQSPCDQIRDIEADIAKETKEIQVLNEDLANADIQIQTEEYLISQNEMELEFLQTGTGDELNQALAEKQQVLSDTLSAMDEFETTCETMMTMFDVADFNFKKAKSASIKDYKQHTKEERARYLKEIDILHADIDNLNVQAQQVADSTDEIEAKKAEHQAEIANIEAGKIETNGKITRIQTLREAHKMELADAQAECDELEATFNSFKVSFLSFLSV